MYNFLQKHHYYICSENCMYLLSDFVAFQSFADCPNFSDVVFAFVSRPSSLSEDDPPEKFSRNFIP